MADPENCVRLTRAVAIKRAVESAGITDENDANKKRVVLGDISNLNIVGSVNKVHGKKTTQKLQSEGKTKTRARVVKPLLNEAKENDEDEKPVDIDAVSDDPQMCGYYVSDIYEYLHQMEVDPKRRPLPDYIEKVQKDVSTNMRAILVDWLAEVAEEYKLVSDTLYMTVSYIYRFLSLNALNLQTSTFGCFFNAHCLYEEINPPKVEDFCYITDNTYTKDELTFPFFLLAYLYSFVFHSTLLHSTTEFFWLNMKVVKMEADILKSLKFELGNPTVKTFLRRFTRVAQEDFRLQSFQLAARVPWVLPCGVEFVGLWMCKFLPSMVAASIIFLTRFIIKPKRHPWSSALQQYSGYKASDLKDCVLIILVFE